MYDMDKVDDDFLRYVEILHTYFLGGVDLKLMIHISLNPQ